MRQFKSDLNILNNQSPLVPDQNSSGIPESVQEIFDISNTNKKVAKNQKRQDSAKKNFSSAKPLDGFKILEQTYSNQNDKKNMIAVSEFGDQAFMRHINLISSCSVARPP